MDNLRAAHRRGCDLFITHEPTFWSHSREERATGMDAPAILKQKFLEETEMVVLRVHDIWDPWPEIGIRDSWARGLGLKRPIAEDDRKYVAVFEIPERPLGMFAKDVAKKVRPLGQDTVWALGEPLWRISRPAIGTGCGNPGMEMVEKGADAFVVCDDGFSYWRQGEKFFEMGVGVVIVSHGTSEMWGIRNLARYLGETFPGLKMEYLDKHPRYWTVPG